MLNLISGLVSGVCLVVIWAVLTKSKRTRVWESAWFDTKGLQEDGNIDPAIYGERKIRNFTNWPSGG